MIPFGDARLPDRFWSKVQAAPNGCWRWQAATWQGYGVFSPPPGISTRRAHRVAYLALIGEVPTGLELDHLCRNRACVNPAHLEPVTSAINQLRGDTFTAAQIARTECPSGHAYDPANTYMHRGHRHCRKCQAQRNTEATKAARRDSERLEKLRAQGRERQRRYRERSMA